MQMCVSKSKCVLWNTHDRKSNPVETHIEKPNFLCDDTNQICILNYTCVFSNTNLNLLKKPQKKHKFAFC